METIEKNKVKKQHILELTNRANATISGVEKVISSSDTCLNLATSEGGLTILGSNFKINKFSALDGTLSFDGVINSLKYSAAAVPLLKRIFK